MIRPADEIVGYAAGFRIDEKTAMSPQILTQITRCSAGPNLQDVGSPYAKRAAC